MSDFSNECSPPMMTPIVPIDIRPFICPRLAVVGNGPLHDNDYSHIASAQCIIRFNDVDNWKPGDSTDVRVVRHPSAIDADWIDAPIWHIAVFPEQAPDVPGEALTLIFEPQYGNENVASANSRIFPRCGKCDYCYENKTFAGPSSGATVISALQGWPHVKSIDVFGMNWHGDARMHIDFADPQLVKHCCTKCRFHDTLTDQYGGTGVTKLILRTCLPIGACLLCFVFALALRHYMRHRILAITRTIANRAQSRTKNDGTVTVVELATVTALDMVNHGKHHEYTRQVDDVDGRAA